MILETIALFKEELKHLGKSAMNETNQLLDNGLQKYVVNYEGKFGQTKTFLFREGRVDFYSTYFPLSLCFMNKRNRLKVPELTDSLFTERHCITILGNAGSGKTMLLKHCFLSTLKHSLQIPVIIELRKLNTYPGTLSNFIQERVFMHKLAKSNHILDKLLESGKFTFMFDGFDELSLQTKERRIRELDAFIDQYNNNFYLLTSRPGANAESLTRFDNYHICPLTYDQIKKFIHLQFGLIEDGEIIEKKILELIDKTENKNYRSYLSSPLLLSMFLLTFSVHPELPTQKSKFYYNVFDTLYSKHDTISKSGSYTHDKKTNLEKEQIMDILKWFSYISYFESHFLFDKEYLSVTLNTVKKHTKIDFKTDDLIYDLSVAISILVEEGLDYSFPHRSLQEYFTAVMIKDLPEQIKKEKIYCNKFIYNYEIINMNLWELCNEVDKYCFNKFFLSSQLNDIIQKLEEGATDKKVDKVLIVKNYFKLIESKMIYDEEEDTIGSLYTDDTSYVSLLKFLKLKEINAFTLFDFIEKYSIPLKPYMIKGKKFSPHEMEFLFSEADDFIMGLYEQSGLTEQIYSLYDDLLKHKLRIEKELEETYNSEVTLLDLV